MRMRYHQIVGMRVVDADGHRLGRVVDLVAEEREGSLRVVLLLVGTGALARRIGFRRAAPEHDVGPHRIPWSAVGQIGTEIVLRASAAALGLDHAAAVARSGQGTR